MRTEAASEMSKLKDRLRPLLRRASLSANGAERGRRPLDQVLARLRTLPSALPVRWHALPSRTLASLRKVRLVLSTRLSPLLDRVLAWLPAARPEPSSRNVVSRELVLPPAAVNENERLLLETVERALRAKGYLR